MIEFKVGDKVRILYKSRGAAPHRSHIFKTCVKKGYGYVVRTCYNEIEVHYDKTQKCGDYFASSDLEPYIDPIPEELFEL